MAELAELVEQVMAVLQDALDAPRQRIALVGERRAGVAVAFAR